MTKARHHPKCLEQDGPEMTKAAARHGDPAIEESLASTLGRSTTPFTRQPLVPFRADGSYLASTIIPENPRRINCRYRYPRMDLPL